MKQSAAAAANQQNQQSANSTSGPPIPRRGLPWVTLGELMQPLSPFLDYTASETRRQLAAQRLAWEMNQRLGF